MQENKQPAEPMSAEGHIEVFKIWKTIQGEGPLVGSSAIFCRVAGCNLQCKWCDTDYTSNREPYTVPELIKALLSQCSPTLDLVVFTGGEPLRQRLLNPVYRELIQLGIRVQVETNGTMPIVNLPLGDDLFTLVVSPKAPKLHPTFEMTTKHERRGIHFKYVMDADYVDEFDGLPLTALGSRRPARPLCGVPSTAVFLQPIDVKEPEENIRHQRACVESCLTYGYRLGLQIHKFIGVE